MRDTWNTAIKISDIRTEDRERFASLGIDFSSFSNCYILPGFADVHVHLREPGFLYKETIQTGTMAAAAGGFTDIFSMPNLDPCPDSREHLQVQLDAIRKDAKVHVYPYGAITVGEKGEQLADLRAMASDVIAFTDDGKGVASEDYMRQAMKQAKELGRIIVAHCEDESYPKESSESEWKQLQRDIRLVRETGCSYHVCHISTRESVELVRSAKAEGLDITCETAPHYLVLSRDDIEDHGRFKMNPPIKGKEDQARTAGSTEGWDYRYDRYRSCPSQCRGKGKRIFWERLRYRRDGNCISSALYSPGNKRETYASGTDKTDAHKSKKAVWSAVKPSWPKRRTGKRKAEFRSLGSGTFLWDRSAEVPVQGQKLSV